MQNQLKKLKEFNYGVWYASSCSKGIPNSSTASERMVESQGAAGRGVKGTEWEEEIFVHC